jgi:hypothetical protein
VEFKSWSLKKVPSSATTTTNPPTTASSKASTLKDVSGVVDVYSRKSGEWGWVTYKDGAFLDGASLMPGDRIATGSNGRVTLQMADGETITLGPDTQLFMSMEWFSDHHLIIMNVGKFRYWHNKATSPNVGATQISVDDVVIVGKGTDFTVEVDTARTITVMVFEGAVSVTDTKSKNGITLIANQRLSIPKNQAGLIQQDMLRRVNYLPPESVDRWWEKASASGLAQAPAWYPVVHPDGSLSIGKVEVISVGSRLTASGFVMTFVLAGAVLFLVAGQVFAWQLRRRYGKTTSP